MKYFLYVVMKIIAYSFFWPILYTLTQLHNIKIAVQLHLLTIDAKIEASNSNISQIIIIRDKSSLNFEKYQLQTHRVSRRQIGFNLKIKMSCYYDSS